MSLLQDILRATKAHTAERRRARPVAELERMIRDVPPPRSLSSALRRERFSIIAEVKVQSPSGGRMDPQNVERAAKAYENSPAISALSIITNEEHFGGSVERLWQVRERSIKPLLRKDFITEPYQVIEARAFGADAVLLMASHFTKPGGDRKLRELFKLTRGLGMEALFEIGMGEVAVPDLAALVPHKAMIWGINSRLFHSRSKRNLRATLSRTVGFVNDLTTSPKRHELLRDTIPHGRIAVAESGLTTPGDIERVYRHRYNAALIGTAFLKSGRVVEDEVEAFSAAVDRINTLPPQ